MHPQEIERTIAEKIEASLKLSPDDTLLGFLDINDTVQNETLGVLRSQGSHFIALASLLRQYPALSVYGLAVAAPIGLQDEDVGGGAFYGAWESAFGMTPDSSQREPLAQQFLRTLDHLGLPSGTISPDHAMHWHGGCYLFHAGILPHFVDPLRSALESAQIELPLPDPDDDEMSAKFARVLADKVHPAQLRLKKVLNSRVGSFLVRRLVRWHLTADNSLFPAHIQPLLREQKGRGVLLRSPFVAFNESEGKLQLVLPAQSSTIADTQTRWVVGEHEFRAANERPPIPLEELASEGSLIIKLARIKDNRPDISCKLEIGFSENRPFRLFDAATGRERKIAVLGDAIELTPGQSYWVVLSESVQVISEHPEEQSGESRFVRLDVTPTSEPLKIQSGSNTWQLKPKNRPGLFFSRDNARTFTATRVADGKEIRVTYGDAVGLTCCVPCESQNHPMAWLSSSAGKSFDYCFKLDTPSSLAADISLYDIGEQLRSWVCSLPPSVQVITATLELDGRKMSYEWCFWKGLERISLYGDFICSQLPENLVHFYGFEKKGCSLIRKQSHTSRPELAFSQLGLLEVERWDIPANRIKIYVISKAGSFTELKEVAELDVLPNDERIIQFRSGGLMPIRLYVNGSAIGEISPDRPVLSRFVGSLVAEYGKAGTIKADTVIEALHDRPWKVLHWRTPQAALECREESSPSGEARWLIRKISSCGISGLRIRLMDVHKKINGEDSVSVLDLPQPEEIATNAESEPIPGLSCSVRKIPGNSFQILVNFTCASQLGTVWLMEFECLPEGTTEWQSLMCCEPYGRLSVIRLLFIGSAPPQELASDAFSELFWGKLSNTLSPDSAVSMLAGAGFKQWIETAQRLVHFKYPTAVWKQNGHRLKSIYERLSIVAANGTAKERASWWSCAIGSLNEHSMESHPVIVPSLLLSHGWNVAALPLDGCTPVFPMAGIISRTMAEAFMYENHGYQNDLNYVRLACEEGRVDYEYLMHYSGWNKILSQTAVPLGNIKYQDWIDRLKKQLSREDPSSEEDDIRLLSAKHLAYCLAKAMHRGEILLDVASQDHGHWLSGPISGIQTSGDAINASVASLLSSRIPAPLVDALWNPAAEAIFTQGIAQRQELLVNLMRGTFLIALVLRAKSRGFINAAAAEHHLKKLLGNRSNTDRNDLVLMQLEMVLGAAPELFTYFFLHFTLSLR